MKSTLIKRVCDYGPDHNFTGMRIRSLTKPNKFGTVVYAPVRGDPFWTATWDGEDFPTSGFFWNDCTCEIYEAGEEPTEEDTPNKKEK